MKRTSLSLFAVLVIVGSLSNEQLTAAQQPAAPVTVRFAGWTHPG